jgi:vanillate monooxygenase
MFLKGRWCAAAWSDELGSQPLERLICGQKLVLFRRPDHSVAALSGVCPHRFPAPAMTIRRMLHSLVDY